MTARLSVIRTLLVFLLALSGSLQAQGKIYFVFGSDTGIWEGMDVGRYHCTYNTALFTDPARNAYAVMNPAFRTALRDAYGTPMKLTWWMMCGNIFRYATNTNMPLPNVMTMYLMRRYHGIAIRQFGDELTLHYHTFSWTDYDRDGRFWWNQAMSFPECREDFDVTLAQLFLEEESFPVSFRSGWHAMDNAWQQYLDELLPYSLHNDWPHKRTTDPEPIDNIFDWSQSPSDFVPFRPSPQNYQLPGGGKGWNVRSIHVGYVTRTLLSGMFEKAQQGTDQVACFWGHLPEADFLTNLQKADSLIHAVAQSYPGVSYRYCSAVEAMQRWRAAADTTAPLLAVAEQSSGSAVSWTISTSEPIFQSQPFVAVKDLYERYHVVACTKTGENQWTTAGSFDRPLLAKMGVVVCDTLGNQSMHVLRYLPDDRYVDDEDAGYQELRGAWQTINGATWGTTARAAVLQPGDSALVRWSLPVTVQGRYNVFLRSPVAADAARYTTVRLLTNGALSRSLRFESPLAAAAWTYLCTATLGPGDNPVLEAVLTADSGVSQRAYADVVRCTPLVRDREIVVEPGFVDFGYVGLDDTARVQLKISNRGVETLQLLGVTSPSPLFFATASFPLSVPPMQSVTIALSLHPQDLGTVTDTLVVTSDDPLQPSLSIGFRAEVLYPFVIVDNDDSLSYNEYGPWQKSVAQAYGATSRFVYLNNTGAYARFRARLPRAGVYEISEIVPTTVNAANAALYVISIAGVPIDSVFIDQNAESGAWTLIGRYYLPSATPVEVTVCNTGASTAGAVLRADAIKWQLVQEIASAGGNPDVTVPARSALEQNYPNPFNPSTVIGYTVGDLGRGRGGDGGRGSVLVQLSVYDILGREMAVLVNERQAPGRYRVTFDGSRFASGTYVYRLQCGDVVQTKKLLLLR